MLHDLGYLVLVAFNSPNSMPVRDVKNTILLLYCALYFVIQGIDHFPSIRQAMNIYNSSFQTESECNLSYLFHCFSSSLRCTS